MNRKRRPPVVTVVLGPGDDRLHLPLHEVEYGDASAAPSIVVWPHVPGETGGADARNRAAARAESRYVAFLAAGVRPEPDWVRNAVDILERDISLAGVGSRVLDAEGRPAGTGSAMLAFFGQPYEWPPALPHGRPDEARDVLFPSAAAMVLRRGPFLEVGGFDERFVGVLDEVDLGWRLWLAGYRVRYEPAVTVVLQPVAADGHRPGDTAAHDSEEIHRLRDRNALATIYKNYSEQTLGRCLPTAMALAVRRDRQRGAAAVDGFVDLLPALAEARRRVQAGRVRSDQEVLRLFGQPPDLLEAGASDAVMRRRPARAGRRVRPRGDLRTSAQDRHRHCRHARPANGRSGDPGLAHRPRPVRRARRGVGHDPALLGGTPQIPLPRGDSATS